MSEFKQGKGSWDDDDLIDSKQSHPAVDAYTDKWIMPFGKHKGKMLSQVPADYLLWLHDNGCSDPKLKAYIVENLDSLNQEAAIRK